MAFVEETFRVKQEEAEELTETVFMKEETENIRIEEVFSLKHEDPEEQTETLLIKEETEDIEIEELFSEKHKDTETQTDSLVLKGDWEEVTKTEEEFQFENIQSCKTRGRSFYYFRSGKSGLTCFHCGQRFCRLANLKHHMGSHIFNCAQCGSGFSRKHELQHHLKGHGVFHPFTCYLCGKGFNTEPDLDAHMRLHTADKPFTCYYCTMSFKQLKTLQVHMREHTKKPKRRSRSKKSAEQSREADANKSPFTCEKCGKGFSSKVNLRKHTKKIFFQCHQCSGTVRYCRNLEDHLRTYCPMEPSWRGKGFTPKKSRKRIYADGKRFRCRLCDQGFDDVKTRKSHERSHVREIYDRAARRVKSVPQEETLNQRERPPSREMPDRAARCRKSYNIHTEGCQPE